MQEGHEEEKRRVSLAEPAEVQRALAELAEELEELKDGVVNPIEAYGELDHFSPSCHTAKTVPK